MLNKIIFMVVGSVLAVGNSCASSSLDDRPVSKICNDVHAVFPNQLTTEQANCFYRGEKFPIQRYVGLPMADNKDVIELGSLSVGNDYITNVKPYRFQFLTGDISTRTRFLRTEIKNQCLYGVYHYKGAGFYKTVGTAADVNFTVKFVPSEGGKIYNLDKLKSGPCLLINMKESILGLNDFISNEVNSNPTHFGVPEACWFSFEYWTSEAATREEAANGLARMPGNIKTWLLICHQLQGKAVYKMDKAARAELADKLLAEEKSNVADKPDEVEQYVGVMANVRRKILEALGVRESDVPNVPHEEIAALNQGKIFFAVTLAN